MGQATLRLGPSVVGYLEGIGHGFPHCLRGYRRPSTGLTETDGDRRQRVTTAGVPSLTDRTLVSAV